MNFSNVNKDEMIRYSAFRLRENAKARGTMTMDHAGCSCGGHVTADAAAAVTRGAMLTMDAKTDAAIASMNAICLARAGKTPAASGFTADAHPGTPEATGPGRYWTPASINTAAAGAWPKRSAA